MANIKSAGKGTIDEKSLFLEMKKLSKRVNQRILRIERLTGQTDTFATKQLHDYLSSKVVNAWTKSGRVAARKDFTKLQMQAIIRASKNFLKQDTSKVTGIKKYTESVSKQAGFKLSYKEASVYYIVMKDYKWIYEYTGSSFWDIARDAKRQGWSERTFIDNIMTFITDRSLDESLERDLRNLYEYAKGVRV